MPSVLPIGPRTSGGPWRLHPGSPESPCGRASLATPHHHAAQKRSGCPSAEGQRDRMAWRVPAWRRQPFPLGIHPSWMRRTRCGSADDARRAEFIELRSRSGGASHGLRRRRWPRTVAADPPGAGRGPTARPAMRKTPARCSRTGSSRLKCSAPGRPRRSTATPLDRATPLHGGSCRRPSACRQARPVAVAPSRCAAPSSRRRLRPRMVVAQALLLERLADRQT